MANPKKPSRPGAWLTRQAMADALDMTTSYFDREVRRHAKPEHVRPDGRKLLFYARGLLDAWYRGRDAAKTAAVNEDMEADYRDALMDLELNYPDPLDTQATLDLAYLLIEDFEVLPDVLPKTTSDE